MSADGGPNVTDDSVDAVRRLVEGLAAERAGPLVAKSFVIDRLLDLRNAAGTRMILVEAIDAVLADIPGATTTTGGWWREQLVFLHSLVQTMASDAERVP